MTPATKKNIVAAAYYLQEAMENFVLPDKITTKMTNLMKMNKLMNIFYVPQNMPKCSKASYIFFIENIR